MSMDLRIDGETGIVLLKGQKETGLTEVKPVDKAEKETENLLSSA
jgi:hypothetical protein